MIDTRFLERCMDALSRALIMLNNSEAESIEYDIYRSACIKEFEIILEQSGKLLKKAITPYFHSDKAVDKLVFKEIFRKAGLHGLLEVEAVERWLKYRDNRNNTAHDYGFSFAEETLILLPQFIEDTHSLITAINNQPHD